MKKKQSRPVTKTQHPEPPKKNVDWVIWAAWADRITFEEIKEKTGLSESHVIQVMRSNLTKSSFTRWRKRASQQSIKHRKRFVQRRKLESPKYPLRLTNITNDYTDPL